MVLAPAANGNAIDFDHSDDAQPALGFDVGSDSDDSGWLIDESRITFTEAGYALYSNGFDEDRPTGPVEEPLVAAQPASECAAPPAAQSRRPWRVGSVRVVDDGNTQGQLRAAALGDAVSASVRAAMARVQLQVPPTFEHVPSAVLDTAICDAVARQRASMGASDGGKEAQPRADDIV